MVERSPLDGDHWSPDFVAPTRRGGRLAQSEALRFSDLRGVAGAILTPIVPVYRRHFLPGQLQFITASTYCRAKLFESERFRQDFVEVLQQLRQEMGFRLIGWVLMPEHFHLLIKPEPAESTSRFMQELKKRTAQRIVSALCENRQHPWCRKTLTRRR